MADDNLYHFSDEDEDEMPCWTARMTGGNSWEAAPRGIPSFNSPCNLLADDAAGAR